mmetsp:Transcript_29276/g.45495  ORF Transcript_29276/g.45495 Transcript_29276/m.45495 type:complete len:281 (-) Transcript_29276:169-1011(-)
MPHPSSWRSRHPSNKAHHRFVRISVLLEPLRSFFLRSSSNLTNHDDALGLRIIREAFQTVDEVSPVKRITSDSDAGRLSQPSRRSLMHGLVGQRATAGYHANFTRSVDVSWHDADLAFTGFDDSGTVRSDEAGLVLSLEHVLYAGHVLLGYTLGDGHNERDFRFNCIHDGLGAEWGWNVNHRGVGLHAFYSFCDRVEDGQAQMFLSALLRGDSAHHLGSVCYGLLAVKCSLLAGEALTNHARIFIDPHFGIGRHGSCQRLLCIAEGVLSQSCCCGVHGLV